MALTDAVCRSAKPGQKRRKLSDGGGLQLWVQPSGVRLWQLAYRFDGRQRQLAIGAYPGLSLAEARIKREDAKRLLRAGSDPAVIARRAPRPGDTFKDVAEEFLMKCRSEELSTVTIEKKKWLLEFAYPDLGSRRLSDIQPVDVLGVLQRVESRGRYETTRRLRATIGAVFRFGVATARASNDPTLALRGATIAPKVTHRAAITEPKRLGDLLRAIDTLDSRPMIKAGLKLLALTFPRPGELRSAEWSEFDLEQAVWTIPAEKTKMSREHRVPLSSQALSILRELKEITGRRAFVLPSPQSTKKPISENAFNLTLRRLGFGSDEMTSHGFRATASTLLNESGKWAEDAIERQLAHIDKNGVRRAYARGAFWDERVRMMQWWDKRITNAEQRSSEFLKGMLDVRRCLPNTVRELVLGGYALCGVDEVDIAADATIGEMDRLVMFRCQLRVIAEKLGCDFDVIKRRVSPECLPYSVLRGAIELHGQSRDRRPGSDLIDIYLVALAPYCDVLLVDRRTAEDVRLASTKQPLLSQVLGRVEKASSYRNIVKQIESGPKLAL